MKLTQVLLALCLSATVAHGQVVYIITQPLGDLPSTGFPEDIELTGDTLGKPDNARFHFNTSSESGNWSGEEVFEFTLTQPTAITVTLNTQSGTNGGDIDFILCSTRNIALDPGGSGKQVAVDDIEFEGLDGALPDSHRFVGLDPGTYYLVAEHFEGFDGGTIPGSTQFTATLTVDEPVVTDFEIILGPIAAANEPVMFNTFGSSFDTVLAVYDPINNVIATNDNAADTNQSYISFPDGLKAGFYYVAVGGVGTTFGDGLALGTGGTTGTYRLNYSRGRNKDLGVATGTTNPAFDTRRVQLYCFEVVDPPVLVEDVGTIATELESITLDTVPKPTDPLLPYFDTELALYDANGFLLARDDDKEPGVIVQSEIVLLDGLTEGLYYVYLAGYNHLFNDGFDPDDLSDPPEMGPYVFNYPGGSFAGDTLTPTPRDGQWFKFTISPLPGAVEITNITRTPTGEVSLTFDSELGATYRIESALEIDAWFPIEAGVASQGFVTTHPVGVFAESQRYFRVLKEIDGFSEF